MTALWWAMVSPMATTLRKLLGGLGVTALFFGSIELAGHLLVGPPVSGMVVKMPDGEAAFFDTVDGRLKPRREEHQRWWPRGKRNPERLRVVVLGGSSVAAPPKDSRFMVNQLVKRLDMEVVNLGIGGMDTGHLIGLIPALEALRPDVVVLYTGHNDFGNAVFEQRYTDPAAVRTARMRQRFGSLWTYQLLERGLHGEEVRTINDAWDPPEVALGDDQRQAILADYTARMRQLISAAAHNGAEVVLSTMVSNPLFPSVAWSCPEQVRALGVRPSRQQRPPVIDLTLEDIAAAQAVEPCRDLDYLAARVQWRQEHSAEAAESLDQLRDTDPLPLRASRQTNHIIRELAQQPGVTLADAASVFRAHGDGLEPPQWFADPVHFSDAGHTALAEVIGDAIVAATGQDPKPSDTPQ